MLSFISAKEAAEKWDISRRRVVILCSENRIDGAMMVGNMWIIPSNAEKPIDKRKINKNRKYYKANGKEFDITIEETISETFRVVAVDEESAIKNAIKKYKKGDLILEPGNLAFTQMQVHDIQNNTYTEWFEF